MTTICTECDSYIKSPGAGIVRGIVRSNSFIRERGAVVCFNHIEEIKDKLHRFGDLPAGKAYEVHERRSRQKSSYMTISPDDIETVLGYLTVQEVEEHFPNTLRRARKYEEIIDKRNSAGQN